MNATGLATYASHESDSCGRLHIEPTAALRGEFQRDRDRIVHAKAFRRLEYKTQVFVNHEGDLFRTRLTHSLEVTQIARSIARALRLNEDLSEAIALAHDLGHTPFGHAGQSALNACMRDYGGFEHNLQSLRVVDKLERRYAEFDGLNLTFETREGILKHCTRARAQQLGAIGARFLRGTQPGLEAQIANLADEIAYNHHDIDDGLRAGLISTEQLRAVPLFADAAALVDRAYPGLDPSRARYETLRRLVDRLITDVIQHSRSLLTQQAPADRACVRALQKPLIAFSPELHTASTQLKHFLFNNLYRHNRVRRMNVKTQRVVSELFGLLMDDPSRLPAHFQERAGKAAGQGARARTVADYIAGMTDRYAFEELRRLSDPSLPA